MSKFLRLKDAAARVTAAGLPLSFRGIQGWCRQYPELSVRLGHRRVVRGDALELILDGLPLAAVAAKMRERAGGGDSGAGG